MDRMNDVARKAWSDFVVTSTPDKKKHEFLCIDGGSGTGKTRLGYDFARQLPAQLSLPSSLYVFMNFGNGSLIQPQELTLGVAPFLGVRLAAILLLKDLNQLALLDNVQHALLASDINVHDSFSLANVLADYSALAATHEDLPKALLLHVDEVQKILTYLTWNMAKETPESAAKAMCRCLMVRDLICGLTCVLCEHRARTQEKRL